MRTTALLVCWFHPAVRLRPLRFGRLCPLSYSQHPTNTVKVSAFNMEKARVSHYLTKANDRYRLSFASFLLRNNSLISRTKAVTLSTFDPISTDPTQKQSATSRSLLLYRLSSEFFIKNKLANKVRMRVIYSILEMP